MPGEDAIREQVRRLLATADGFSPDGLEPHDYQDHASVVLDMIRPLVGRVAELEAERSAVLALHRKHSDSDHCFADDEAWPCQTLTALGRTGAEPPSPWDRAVAGLNALVDADVIFHVEPDGHISAPFSDEHIEWDLKAKRWVLTRDDDYGVHPNHSAPCRVPESPDCTCPQSGGAL
ncbi:hypothetical protein GTY83_07350 [Streptomyces sp. SID4928]|uniref:hypothetical protein n=1 Tax=unclassified Streptomyces TaxID=2593676 RepID=UPI0001C1C3FB|nr:hypothetical protein [Streptomyces sp. ACT-1]EGE40857.1 hypothetical protein SACT1_1492 [Streptomyces sp. ACT-1]MYR48921.1 hypothetical protein [Streptomyces sp. SID4928]